MIKNTKGQSQNVRLLKELLGQHAEDVEQLLSNIPRFRDINEALIKSEAQNKAILEGHRDMVFAFDADLEVVSANESAESLCQDPLGKTCQEIFNCPSKNCPNCIITQAFSLTPSVKMLQKILVTNKRENELCLEVTSSPVVGQNGDVERAVVVVRDVTERLQMEKKLRHASKMEAVGTLAGGIAHDFNNLLTPIMGYSEIIRMHMQGDNPGKDEVFECVEEILKAARRAKKLVEQVLTFSRSGDQKESSQYLHPIVKEVMRLIETTLPSTITIRKEISEDCSMVSVDPAQVHEMLINMCTNAANAMTGIHGTLTVCLQRADMQEGNKEWVELSVSDTGCGIDPQLQQRIFEPYFTTSEKQQGTGMGLAMLHGIIQRLGGKIEVDSELGKGTTFYVYLPVTEETTVLEQVVNPQKAPGGSEHILLVDDEMQVVDVARKILEHLGYTVTAKQSAQETLLIFAESPERFDLLITDQIMPYMTGSELSQKVKEIKPGFPVILFSGLLEDASQLNVDEFGVEGVCAKPVSFQEMASTVRNVIDNHSKNSNS